MSLTGIQMLAMSVYVNLKSCYLNNHGLVKVFITLFIYKL